MNELMGQSKEQEERSASIIFSFTNGMTYTQEVYWKQADLIEDLLAWFRDKNSKPVWTWDYTPVSKLMLIQKSQIMSIEIEGYIELTRTTQKWHEKLFDKFRTKFIFLKMKGGDPVSKRSGKMGGKGGKKY